MIASMRLRRPRLRVVLDSPVDAGISPAFPSKALALRAPTRQHDRAMRFLAALLALVLLLAGAFAPSVEAASRAGETCAKKRCCCDPTRDECTCNGTPAPP